MYIARWIYDMAYWLILNVIFMNIIFGIIIDTFAGSLNSTAVLTLPRAQRQEVRERR